MGPRGQSELLLSTGVPGMDFVLGGGLTPNRFYLAQGDPGAGKTTFALQFLLAGAAAGESTLYVTLSETKEELEGVAASHGWSLDKARIFEILVGESVLRTEEQYSVFHLSEMELGETMETLITEVERVKPRRVVIDSLSEMRLLARDPLRYRRQILGLKQFFAKRDCTVLLLDELASRIGDHQFQTLAHGVFQLEQFVPEFGGKRRRLQVVKLRGQGVDGAYHDFTLTKGGITVFPRLVAADFHYPFTAEMVPSGIPQLDELLGGGVGRGTSALILGSSGTGKSTLATRYAATAAARGEHSVLFLFDERVGTFTTRAKALGMDLDALTEQGTVTIHQIDPSELAPGQFMHLVSEAVIRDKAKLVVIDSLNGYLNAMPEARFLLNQMHELLTFLSQQGVMTLLIVSQHGGLGVGIDSPVDVSYLADSVIWLRYFEFAGEVRKALSVVKNRTGAHESTIREMQITSTGVQVGQPLSQFRGVLTGTPEYLVTRGNRTGADHDYQS
jgi:circadian clock protein KaiC